MKPTANTTRERIVAAASKLFYGQGIRAVSVDAVAEKAGLTKRTLYYHFASKDDLIAAYLERRDQPNLGLFRHWFSESEGELADKVAAIFQHLAAAARRPAWKGCGFLRTAAELADMPGHPAIRIGIAHKKNFEAWLKTVFEAESIEGNAEPVVIRTKTETAKPMSVDEAVMQMDLLHKDFIVFTDSINNELSVLYRRKDGNFGLIEPQRA